MIRVMAQPEYREFDRQVRQPGLAFLRRKGAANVSRFQEEELLEEGNKAPSRGVLWLVCLHDDVLGGWGDDRSLLAEGRVSTFGL